MKSFGALVLLSICTICNGFVARAPVGRLRAPHRITMIAVGDTLPNVSVKVAGEVRGILDLFANQRGVLFAVPGAFTPTCSEKHLPGFVEQSAAIKGKAPFVGCVAVNDPFVLDAWAKTVNAPTSAVTMISDGNGEFTKAIGMEMDASGNFLGTRSKRYAMIIAPGGRVEWIGEGDDAFANVVMSKL
ncbi:unnamed protein product [Vitrella brassicaformis CCMP3155]|uniref:Thioredoxin domain-containing protein n=2 Tax=Vitrella brassicaformis TaxID=1169539 RepID=A0A0G4EJH2_VITBC|nr:unnamed protein product [Vitrella brassicaformis CCMP3155]|mmetsp:Transcript_18966/g.45735  ORF Transcript_18966/g.45735 Transcript_18966/m.45735 type:complete len:187 (+) Transcript_18966:50-610(+)|eukprot:CEL96642.1 unnamed protein product [Vitrella brassicaformis CCMP3155]